jgi:YgiT-type zinc finger domain-containing protein
MEADVDGYDEYLEELKDMDGSPCIACPEGHLKVSAFTKTMERKDTTLVVKEVPALVCDTCGDVNYTDAIGQRLSEMVTAVKEAGAETAVCSFRHQQNAS